MPKSQSVTTSAWWPSKDCNHDKSDGIDLFVDVPEGLIVAGNGDIARSALALAGWCEYLASAARDDGPSPAADPLLDEELVTDLEARAAALEAKAGMVIKVVPQPIMTGALGAALLAGLISFLSPCVLPLIR